MGDDIEERLAAAAAALREHELTTRRVAELQRRVGAAEDELRALRARLDAEQADVHRLAGLTLGRLVASLRGARDDELARERAEAEAVRYRVTEAEQRLAALRAERAKARARQTRLVEARRVYEMLLNERERELAGTDDPRRTRLLELADERGRLAGEQREVTEALRAADPAADRTGRRARRGAARTIAGAR
ncbi:hypothetical protein GA0070624_4228 [Micromonospora rhizosphaerae]|uniref:Uncharacterized protein n=1 Tax=Micromonospora rhizosphaerae TaxID=568872 RepID=A0A1C6SNV0_9ACTN|nr:hypothetical protein [Micromonospora rhizosphaerae]SCL31221.1 hypothetical protein GA0070624_4228 [Micromonospora rhizosphaerae]